MAMNRFQHFSENLMFNKRIFTHIFMMLYLLLYTPSIGECRGHIHILITAQNVVAMHLEAVNLRTHVVNIRNNYQTIYVIENRNRRSISTHSINCSGRDSEMQREPE